jgi:anti-sigma factor RsiW
MEMPERNNTDNKTSLSCKEVTALIMEYLNGNISRDVAVAFEAHLAECPDCKAFLNTYKKTVELTRSFLKKK